MSIQCTSVFEGDYLCGNCLGEHQSPGPGLLYVLVEDGDTDDEQYVCETCAKKVVETGVLPRLSLAAAKPS